MCPASSLRTKQLRFSNALAAASGSPYIPEVSGGGTVERIENLPARLAAIQAHQPACPVRQSRVLDVADFIEDCIALAQDSWLWFRGHSRARWRLTPSALRHEAEADRTEALARIRDFKRLAVRKIENPPPFEQALEWVQIARHYGLPTRLLDWTQNAAIGLYFACRSHSDDDGVVFVLNPVELNLTGGIEGGRILDATSDTATIHQYLELGGRIWSRGRPTVALNPIWNSERLVLQKGVFTLHGSKNIEIDVGQAPSLIAFPVLAEDKREYLAQLSLIGIDEMSIFPEPEYVCRYLARNPVR